MTDPQPEPGVEPELDTVLIQPAGPAGLPVEVPASELEELELRTDASGRRVTEHLAPDDVLYSEFLLVCRANPESWMRCAWLCQPGDAARIETGAAFGAFRGEFEACERTTGAGEPKVLYTRYVGPVTSWRGAVVAERLPLLLDSMGLEDLSHVPASETLFENPPQSKFISDIGDWLDQIRHHPGVWVRRAETHTAAASLIKNGRAYKVRKGEFLATSRTVDGYPKGRCDLYVMYIGDEKREPLEPGTGQFELDFASPSELEGRPPVSDKHPGALTGGHSPITAWLNRVVRPSGEWCEAPMDLPAHTRRRLKLGLMYGAQPGEFEIMRRKNDDGSGHRTWVRVNPAGPDLEPMPPDSTPQDEGLRQRVLAKMFERDQRPRPADEDASDGPAVDKPVEVDADLVRVWVSRARDSEEWVAYEGGDLPTVYVEALAAGRISGVGLRPGDVEHMFGREPGGERRPYLRKSQEAAE